MPHSFATATATSTVTPLAHTSLSHGEPNRVYRICENALAFRDVVKETKKLIVIEPASDVSVIHTMAFGNRSRIYKNGTPEETVYRTPDEAWDAAIDDAKSGVATAKATLETAKNRLEALKEARENSKQRRSA